MKSQAWSMDFVSSVVIFVTAIVILSLAVSYVVSQNVQQKEINRIEELALSISDALIRTQGYPEDWNETNVINIGLASEENILNESKVRIFIENLSDDVIMHRFGAGDCKFYFELRDINGEIFEIESGVNATKGEYPTSPEISIPVERFVLYRNRPSKILFILWK